MKKYTLYKIEFPNGECYIGQTSKHEYVRWGSHLSELDRNKHINSRMQDIYDEEGADEWVFKVLKREVSDDSAYIHLLEQHYVNEHPTCVNRTNKNNGLSEDEVKIRASKNSKRWYHERGGRKKALNYYHATKKLI
jgi:hypothetical protein